MRAQAATEVRKEVNKLDNLTTGKAVDALLNFETVALFNNQVRPTTLINFTRRRVRGEVSTDLHVTLSAGHSCAPRSTAT